MKQFLDLGFYISFSGIVTFPKAHDIHECAKLVPNDKYLIETDSPFLAPVPHRGKRNEPSFVENVANFMADLRTTDLITIAKESSKNAEDLFKFDLLRWRDSCYYLKLLEIFLNFLVLTFSQINFFTKKINLSLLLVDLFVEIDI